MHPLFFAPGMSVDAIAVSACFEENASIGGAMASMRDCAVDTSGDADNVPSFFSDTSALVVSYGDCQRNRTIFIAGIACAYKTSLCAFCIGIRGLFFASLRYLRRDDAVWTPDYNHEFCALFS